MSGPIARRPSGLLDLLLTQQQGKNPSELGDMVAPTIEMGPFYDAERLAIEEADVTMTVPDTFLSFKVPSGEAWRLLRVSGRAVYNATGQDLRMMLFLALGTTDFVTLGQNPKEPGLGGADQVSCDSGPLNIVVPSGTQIGLKTQRVALGGGGAIATTAAALFVRMNT